MHTTTRTIEDTHPAGTNVQITIDGQTVRVQVCMADLRHGYRVANTMWGGRIDMWVPIDDLHNDQEVPAMEADNTHECTVCGFAFSGSRLEIIDGKLYCADDAPTTDAQRSARQWFAVLLNNR